ncbi:BREX-1 system adenine-specific DNA-methyltransferase PglX [Vibrio rotiferianus]|uniref:BREX-1 system adenine-specific DNA-methyltransferase PglX n=1 Tax=Vibrio rotiferianus TaxID=190895 RepID=UPI0015F61B61|nr:BREX-1 system adenine-specific DNA-methyltransferase PglX [Vibrio rotiferianus]
MNTNNIKKYAPKARIAFYEAVKVRAHNLGIYADHFEDPIITGDVMQVGDKTFPASQKAQRDALVKLIEQQGFEAVIDHTASTWFNRLCAIRFMELKEYLDHGYRVLSHPSQANGFEILGHAADVAEELGLNRAEVLEMSLAGDKEEELYRQLLLGQCHALHDAMDFLFDKVDSVSELLLPDGLTRTDSILRSLVDDVPEEDWEQVEIIGWLYQFYISEKKDEVIGKVVKSEDIPAATQLFTPNWIVQYLVQNSVGRQWLQTYPESSIKAEMPYYIEPAEQSDEVNAQLAEITPDSLEPEAIKVLDPACGSGHILVEAYNTLKAIYDERGYRSREIPQLILENNLFGLDIDDRAAQLAGFALMMMAREDDRRIFTRGVKLNVLSLQESTHLDIPQLWRDLDLNGDQQVGQSQDLFAEEAEFDAEDEQFKLLQQIKQWFLQAKTLGSLIDVSAEYQQQLQDLKDKLLDLQKSGNTAQKPAADLLLAFVHQAWLLSQRYDSIVANPPYMGGKGMNKDLKDFAKKSYPNSKSDLFAMFMERAFELLNEAGFNAQVNMQSWMFLSSFEKMRESLLDSKTFITMAHLGARAFSQISGEVVQTTAWVLNKRYVEAYQPVFFRLIEGNEDDKKNKLLERKNIFFDSNQLDLKEIPGSPISYWVNGDIRKLFIDYPLLKSVSSPKVGLNTTDNAQFLRMWHEVDISKFSDSTMSRTECIESGKKWFAYNKGGSYRKWYGNNEYVVNWWNDGHDIKTAIANDPAKQAGGRVVNEDCYFKPSISWSLAGAKSFTVRMNRGGFVFDVGGSSIFPSSEGEQLGLCAILTSNISTFLMGIINPTFNFQAGNVAAMPIALERLPEDLVKNKSEKLYNNYKQDWDNWERSWEFTKSPLLISTGSLVKQTYEEYLSSLKTMCDKVYHLELELNEVINTAYDIRTSDVGKVQLEEITLTSNLKYRYSEVDNRDSKLTHCSDTLVEFVSYAVGCMMGRYSLDREGLVYAHAGNEGFTDLVNEGAYKTFAADDDGIIPLTDMEWFPDDATYRFRDFVRTVWGEEHLQENLDFVAESLCLHAIKPKRGESSLDTIRRYMSAQFYKDHLKTYKKRPIYWLFSSGKQKAFECLVYLHRYNESTLSRMRTENVTPLLGKYEARLGQLEQQLDSASTSEKTKLKKEITALEKKQVELRTFDDKLKHFADMRISLDLDNGVKVNYGKFGDLLADVKAIHGKVVK